MYGHGGVFLGAAFLISKYFCFSKKIFFKKEKFS
jgi:hypothetical protein